MYDIVLCAMPFTAIDSSDFRKRTRGDLDAILRIDMYIELKKKMYF